MSFSFSRAAALAAFTLVSLISPSRGATLAPDRGFDAPEFARPNPATRLVLLPDGKLLRYNSTQTLAERRTGPITRHFADGTVDPSFNLAGNFDGVGAAAAFPDGRIVVSVIERRYDGGSERLMRLNADGSVDGSFHVTTINNYPAFEVAGIVPLTDGKMLVSGFFYEFAGEKRRGIVRLLADGTLDTSFAAVPIFSGRSGLTLASLGLTKPVLQPDGKILIAWNFTRIGDTDLPAGVARLHPDGTLDAEFRPVGFTRQGTTREPIVQVDGRIVLAGRFTTSRGPNVALLRLNANGSIDESYQSQAGGQGFSIRSLALQGDKIIVAESIGLRTLFRFDADGSLDRSFRQPVFQMRRKGEGAAVPLITIVQPDGRILVAGIFTDVDDAPGAADGSHYGLARFQVDGALDPTLTTPEKTALKDYPDSFVRMPDSTTLIGFRNESSTGEGAIRHNFGRLRADGSLDASFDPLANADPNGPLTPDFLAQGFRLYSDGKIFLFGSPRFSFTAFTYTRLLPDGSVDGSFTADPAIERQFGDSGFDDVYTQPDGTVLVASSAAQTIVDGDAIRRIAPNGSLDSSFQLDPEITSRFIEREAGTGLIYRIRAGTRLIAVQPDGKLLFVYGAAQLVRLNANGSRDESFAPVSLRATHMSETFPQIYDPYTGRTLQPAEGVLSGENLLDAAVQPDGRIVIAGLFDAIDETPVPGFARLNADGSLDSTFQIGDGPQWTQTSRSASFYPTVEQVELQSDGRLLVAGTFEAFSGVSAPGIVSLNANGSVDTSFVAPAVRQKSLGGRAKLARQSDGSFLLSGPYSYPGENTAPSLLRIAESNSVPSSVANISTRLAIGTGENVLIGGFIITGNAPKKVIIRGIGPSLRAGDAPLAGRLEDPVMELRDSSGELLMENDDWRTAQEGEITASQVPPQDNREAAIVATLNPGAYTAVVSGKGNSTGIGLVEVYDLGTTSSNTGSSAKLANISTRGFVQTGDNVMIGGFIVTGASSRLIVRAIGPSLSGSGIAGALQDPTLDFVDGNGSLIATNDDWRTGGQEQQIMETTLQPSNDREAAILATVNPGAYTTILRGKGSATGVALIELYALP